jgi:hypothetical protein
VTITVEVTPVVAKIPAIAIKITAVMGQIAPVICPVIADVGPVVTDIGPVMTKVHAVVADIAPIIKTALGLGTYGKEKAGGEEYHFRVHTSRFLSCFGLNSEFKKRHGRFGRRPGIGAVNEIGNFS